MKCECEEGPIAAISGNDGIFRCTKCYQIIVWPTPMVTCPDDKNKLKLKGVNTIDISGTNININFDDFKQAEDIFVKLCHLVEKSDEEY